jgi:hypothetical protein
MPELLGQSRELCALTEGKTGRTRPAKWGKERDSWHGKYSYYSEYNGALGKNLSSLQSFFLSLSQPWYANGATDGELITYGNVPSPVVWPIFARSDVIARGEETLFNPDSETRSTDYADQPRF